MNELLGQQLGQYQIENKIGQGGMAVVYKAYQSSLDRHVAIKVLPPTSAEDENFVKRFRREARSIAQLNHPNILPIFDFGVEQGYSFIVMRYVAGSKTLRSKMRRFPELSAALPYLKAIAGALNHAHQNGIIHRDIKPSNVLLDDEWVLLADFGLAKIKSETATQLTGSNVGMGTLAYLSPEQGLGRDVDHRTDVYALGIMVYEILTKSIPQLTDTAVGTVMLRSSERPPSPQTLNPSISDAVANIVLKALAPEPTDRFYRAVDFVDTLVKAINDSHYVDPASHTTDAYETVDVIVTQPDDLPNVDTHPNASSHQTILSSPRTTGRRGFGMFQFGWGLIAAIALGLIGWGASGFFPAVLPLIATPTPTPTVTAAFIAQSDEPTPTPLTTATATSLPTETATPMNTSTATQIIMEMEPPTDTATPQVIVVTATPTITPQVIVVTETSLPAIATPTVVVDAPSPITPTDTPTAEPPLGEEGPIGRFELLGPIDLEQPSYGITTFEWRWDGPLPDDYGFEVRVWREGEPPQGVHDAVNDNLNGVIKEVADGQFRLITDITETPSVAARSGEYLWTVVLVQVNPEYADLGEQAPPARLRFEAGGDDSGSSDRGSSGATIK